MKEALWTRRDRAVLTIVTAAAVLSGLVSGTSSAVEGEPAVALFDYSCQFPAQSYPVQVEVEAAFPAEVSVDEAITPSNVSVRATLPAAAVSGLRDTGATVAGGVASLSTTITTGMSTSDVVWEQLDITSLEHLETGSLVVVAGGEVPEMTANSPGETVVRAGALRWTFELDGSNGSKASSTPVECILSPGIDDVLATISVVGDNSSPTTSSSESSPEEPNRTEVDPPAGDSGASDKGNLVKAPLFPDECLTAPDVYPANQPICTYLGGYANVQKLNGSMRIDPALLSMDMSSFEISFPWATQHAIAILALPSGEFPAADATFLQFGFMPISAKAELTAVKPIELDVRAQIVPPFEYGITSRARMLLRLYDVEINGVSLDVGANCRTVEPIKIRLKGGTPEYKDVSDGGPMSGFYEIPKFAGCGVSEDLDPLVSSSISGKHNYVKMTQGKLCFTSTPEISNCPPVEPELIR